MRKHFKTFVHSDGTRTPVRFVDDYGRTIGDSAADSDVSPGPLGSSSDVTDSGDDGATESSDAEADASHDGDAAGATESIVPEEELIPAIHDFIRWISSRGVRRTAKIGARTRGGKRRPTAFSDRRLAKGDLVLTAAPDAVVTYEQALHDERIGPALRAALHEPTVARFSAEDRGVFVVTAYLAYAAFFHPDKPLGGWQSMLSRTTSLLPPRLGDAETALLTVCTHCRYHYNRLQARVERVKQALWEAVAMPNPALFGGAASNLAALRPRVQAAAQWAVSVVLSLSVNGPGNTPMLVPYLELFQHNDSASTVQWRETEQGPAAISVAAAQDVSEEFTMMTIDRIADGMCQAESVFRYNVLDLTPTARCARMVVRPDLSGDVGKVRETLLKKIGMLHFDAGGRALFAATIRVGLPPPQAFVSALRVFAMDAADVPHADAVVRGEVISVLNELRVVRRLRAAVNAILDKREERLQAIVEQGLLATSPSELPWLVNMLLQVADGEVAAFDGLLDYTETLWTDVMDAGGLPVPPPVGAATGA